jgi:hypothetical protein
MQLDDHDLADADTDVRARPGRLEEPAADPSEAITDKTRLPGFGEDEAGPWRLNHLGVLLLAALLVTLLAALALRIQLTRARSEAATAIENMAELDERLAELGRAPAADVHAPPAAAGDVGAKTPGKGAAPAADEAAPRAGPTAVPDSRLYVLLTVGTRHFAEKQLRRLRHRCGGALALYRQKRGRCAFSECWVVAAPESDSEQARSCGKVKGQAMRDRRDFVGLASE